MVGVIVALFVVGAVAGGGEDDDKKVETTAAQETSTTAPSASTTEAPEGTDAAQPTAAPTTAEPTTTVAPTTAPPTTAEPALPTIPGAQGDRDEIDDVTMTRCGISEYGNYGEVDLTVVNNSSKPSTYFIEIRIESKDGKTAYGTASAVITNLGPNQTMQETAVSFDEVSNPADMVCLIASVSRTAS